jgi:hypothetical protein
MSAKGARIVKSAGEASAGGVAVAGFASEALTCTLAVVVGRSGTMIATEPSLGTPTNRAPHVAPPSVERSTSTKPT